jgi:hypothetical protein
MTDASNTPQMQFNLTLPSFNPPVNPAPAPLPSSWQCTALLHPFSPPTNPGEVATVPFFQLCTAQIRYVEGMGMLIAVSGEDGQMWYYFITLTETKSFVAGRWLVVDMGWTLPTTQWLSNSNCVGSSYLNWMNAQLLDWWKTPVPNSKASTWFWYNTEGATAGYPFRMMFGQPPASPTKGDPAQLAFFQMFSFSYLCNFQAYEGTLDADAMPDELLAALPSDLEGFSFGNTANYEKFIWNANFGMTTFMTPVDEASNPLPTQVLYTWAADEAYQVLTDRAQSTVMNYTYNPNDNEVMEQALMFGAAPATVVPPPNSGQCFIVDNMTDGSAKCQTLPLSQEASDWTYTAGEQGTIHACIANNPELCPGNNLMVVSVLFPSTQEYPQGRYLWTWYSPFPDDPTGLHSRPVTFMESASTIAEGGTSLALADYFDYQEFSQQIAPSNFQISSSCNVAQV